MQRNRIRIGGRQLKAPDKSDQRVAYRKPPGPQNVELHAPDSFGDRPSVFSCGRHFLVHALAEAAWIVKPGARTVSVYCESSVVRRDIAEKGQIKQNRPCRVKWSVS